MTLNINDLWRLCTAIKNYAESESPYTALASQLANRAFATPNGSAGTPSYRVLVANDIPNLDTSKITTGTFDASIIGAGVINNARVNWASPAAIGGTTPAAGTFLDVISTGYFGRRLVDNNSAGDTSIAATTTVYSHRANSTLNITLPQLSSLYIAISGTEGYAPMIFIRNESNTNNKTLLPDTGNDIDGAASLALNTNTAVLVAGISTTRWRVMMNFP